MLLDMLKILQDQKAPSWVPWRWPDLFLDSSFYDTAAVGFDEWWHAYTSNEPMREGNIVIVSPGKEAQALRAYDVRGYLGPDELKDIQTIAVAGCGSSRVGAIALGRTVANALDKPVASVIAGYYGMRDLAIDAMLGTYWARVNGLLRAMDSVMHEILKRLPTSALLNFAEVVYDIAYVTPEAATIHDLLLHRPGQFTTIVGHSKGNLAIEAALNALKFSLQEVDDERVLEGFGLSRTEDLRPGSGEATIAAERGLDIFTFGCVVSLPHQYGMRGKHSYPAHQYIGNCDVLGHVNTSPLDIIDMYMNKKQIDTPEVTEKAVYGGPVLHGHNLQVTDAAWQMFYPMHMPIDQILETYASQKFCVRKRERSQPAGSPSVLGQVPQRRRSA